MRLPEVSRAHGARVVHVAKRRIAAARNGGARAANADILCFIDADSAIHPQTFDAIDRVMKSGRYVWGVTGATMERMSLPLFITYWFFMPMVLLTGLDMGLSFCRREDFEVGRWLRREPAVRGRRKISDGLAPPRADERPANNADTAGQGAWLHAQVRSIRRLALLLDAGPRLQESDHLELARRKAGGSVLV